MSRSIKVWLTMFGLITLTYGSWLTWRTYEVWAGSTHDLVRSASLREVQPVEPPLDEFTLIDQRGDSFDSRSLHGQVWVASFFFTNCPAICWRMNQALAALQQTNPDSAAKFVSITCDPENDTPQVLDRYAHNFKADPARWIFLTGNFDYIHRVANDLFKVALEKEMHTSKTMVVDRQGRVRGRFAVTEPEQLAMLKRLLVQLEAEPAPKPAESQAAK